MHALGVVFNHGCIFYGILLNDEKYGFIRPSTKQVTISPKVGNAEWAEDRVPVWYIMDEFGARVQHSADAPNVRMVPFISTIDGAAYSLLFPVQNVDEGEEITRHY